jgi:hypothetical protein
VLKRLFKKTGSASALLSKMKSGAEHISKRNSDEK